MQRRSILLSLVILTAVGGWVLRPERAASPASLEVSLDVGKLEPELEPEPVAPQDEPPTSIELDPPTEALGPPSPSDPLDRQRRRLLATSASLAAHRDAARTSGAPEPVLQALDAHRARVQQRIATLDGTITGASVAEGALQAAPAAGPVTVSPARP